MSVEYVWKLVVYIWNACFLKKKIKCFGGETIPFNTLKTIFLLRVWLICGAGHSGYP